MAFYCFFFLEKMNEIVRNGATSISSQLLKVDLFPCVEKKGALKITLIVISVF